MCDNTTAVHTINNMGTCKSHKCNRVVQDIWEWARLNNTWLTACHIAGKINVEADLLLRKNNMSSEWKLNVDIFNHIQTFFKFKPTIDLFASRVNKQIKIFVAYKPDPDTTHINAFTLD